MWEWYVRMSSFWVSRGPCVVSLGPCVVREEDWLLYVSLVVAVVVKASCPA